MKLRLAMYLITGANGFIGQRLVNKLKREGVSYKIISSSTQKISEDVISWGELNSTHKIHSFLNGNNYKLIHCGWGGVLGKDRNELTQVINNHPIILGLDKLLETGLITHISALGSQAEYGVKNKMLDETETCFPKTIYAKAKLAHYHLIDSLASYYNVPFSWLRIFSLFGEGDNPNWLLPMTITKLSQGERVDLSPCTQTWDYLSVEDAVDAIISVSRSKARGILNVASGSPVVLKDILLEIGKEMDRSAFLNFGAIKLRDNEPNYLLADITKIKRETGWTPKINIWTEIPRMIKYYG